jgi:hypothetical protein
MSTNLRPLLASLLLLTACSSSSTSNNASDGGAAGGDGGGTAGAVGAGALTCGAIFDCISKCAADDSTCVNTCFAAGTPDAQTAVNNVATCYQNHSCADSTCLQTNCTTEMQACVATAAGGAGQPLTGAAPTGNIPQELVGEWIGSETLYDFKADGTVARSSNVTDSSCQTSSVEDGTAVASGTTLTMYFTTGIFKICGTTSTDPYKPVTDTFTYRIDNTDVGTALRLAQQNCSYTDQSDIDFYCTNGFDKQ